MVRGRLARLVLVVGAILVALTLGKTWPSDMAVHFVLGDAAARVEQLDACWSEGTYPSDCSREVSFRFVRGAAPRVVTSTMRIAAGDYVVHITIVADGERSIVDRRVTLGGGVTSIDLALQVPHGRDASNGRSPAMPP
jgi:hypothetical protein